MAKQRMGKCPSCKGRKFTEYRDIMRGTYTKEQCRRCNGTGRVSL